MLYLQPCQAEGSFKGEVHLVSTLAQQAVTPSYTTFWSAGITLIVSCAVFVPLTYHFRVSVDQWLTKGRARRAVMTALFVVVFPVVIAAIVDFVDLSDAAAGKVDDWDPFALSCGVLLFCLTALSQIVLWWHTDRWDERVRIANEAKEQAEDTLGFALEIATTFLSVVGRKADRVRALIARGRKAIILDEDLKAALSPSEQIVALVNAVYALFRARVHQAHALRVALFRLDGEYYAPVQCWDGATTSCVTSPTNHLRENFKVNAAGSKCLLVHAAQGMNIQIVSNADEAAGNPAHPFNHFDHDQSRRIKSIAVLPLRRGNENGPITTILSIDTTQPGFFTDTRDRPRLELLAKNLAHRLLFEQDIAELIG